jgi:hypothetical protein
MPKKEPVQLETPRRGHAALKYNPEVAEQFGIRPNEVDMPRELVRVESLPDPPATETVEKVVPGKRRKRTEVDPINPEEHVNNILKQEAEEIAVRLERIGIIFAPAQQQSLVDYGMAILSGIVSGGTLARRPL